MEVFTRFKPYNAYFDDVDFDAEGDEPFDLDGVDFISWSEELFTMPVNCGICNGPSQYYEDNDNVCMTCDSTWVYDEGGEKGEGYYRKSAEMQAEGDDYEYYEAPSLSGNKRVLIPTAVIGGLALAYLAKPELLSGSFDKISEMLGKLTKKGDKTE